MSWCSEWVQVLAESHVSADCSAIFLTSMGSEEEEKEKVEEDILAFKKMKTYWPSALGSS